MYDPDDGKKQAFDSVVFVSSFGLQRSKQT